MAKKTLEDFLDCDVLILGDTDHDDGSIRNYLIQSSFMDALQYNGFKYLVLEVPNKFQSDVDAFQESQLSREKMYQVLSYGLSNPDILSPIISIIEAARHHGIKIICADDSSRIPMSHAAEIEYYNYRSSLLGNEPIVELITDHSADDGKVAIFFGSRHGPALKQLFEKKNKTVNFLNLFYSRACYDFDRTESKKMFMEDYNGAPPTALMELYSANPAFLIDTQTVVGPMRSLLGLFQPKRALQSAPVL